MNTLSRKQTLIILIGIGLVIATALITSGKMDMSSLSSSVLEGSGYICTENGQKRNLNEYNQAVRNRDQTQGKIKIMSGEITTLNKTIGEHKKTIGTNEGTIEKQTTTIGELTGYISKTCNNPKSTKEKTICAQKKQQKSSLEQNNKTLTNQINSLKTLIGTLEGKTKQKDENIATWNKKIEELGKFIKDYDSCNESLKSKLIITSPLMSGDVNKVLEVGKRVELYKFSMSIPAPAKAEINEIKFDTGFGPGNVDLDDWYVTENSTATSIYPCKLENNGQFRCVLERKESGNFGLENGRTQEYFISAMVKDIKAPGSLKIYGISKEGVVYNSSRRDANNQSTPIKINYTQAESAKVVITSPLMSGEVTMPNEEVVNLHTAIVTVPKDGIKTQIESIDYTLDIAPAEGLSFGGWHIVSSLGSGKCDVVPGGNILRVRCPVNFTSPYLTDNFIYPGNSIEYILKGSLPKIEFAGTITTSLVDVKYNGGVSIDNQTTPVKMKYSSIEATVCGNRIVEGNETCDDGNTNDEDGCTNICQIGVNICELAPDLPQCKSSTIKLTYPNGGELLKAGNTYNITWSSGDISASEDVYIYIGYAKTGTQAGVYDEYVGEIKNTGQYVWTIPEKYSSDIDITPGSFLIRIGANINNVSVEDRSDAGFSIEK